MSANETNGVHTAPTLTPDQEPDTMTTATAAPPNRTRAATPAPADGAPIPAPPVPNVPKDQRSKGWKSAVIRQMHTTAPGCLVSHLLAAFNAKYPDDTVSLSTALEAVRKGGSDVPRRKPGRPKGSANKARAAGATTAVAVTPAEAPLLLATPRTATGEGVAAFRTIFVYLRSRGLRGADLAGAAAVLLELEQMGVPLEAAAGELARLAEVEAAGGNCV